MSEFSTMSLLAASKDEHSGVERLPDWLYLLTESLLVLLLLSEHMAPGVLYQLVRSQLPTVEI